MPRIYDSRSEPIDFCWKHFPKTEEAAEQKYGNRGDGPDGRGNCFGYDCDHPPYGEFVGEYRCEICNVALTVLDN